VVRVSDREIGSVDNPPTLRQDRPYRKASGDRSATTFGCCADDGPCQHALRSIVAGERHVDIFEKGTGGDSFHAIGGLDEIIAGSAGLFAAEGVGECEGFGELTSAHQESGAVDGPLIF